MERDKLQSMRQQCANLSQALLNLEGDVNEGTIRWTEIVRGTRRTVEDAEDDLLTENFKTLEDPNEPAPTLIYDGPFSDHIDQEQPKGLTGGTITKEEARDIARDFPDYAGNPNLVIKDLGTAQGKIEAYQFSVQPNGDAKNHTTIDVTKKGGHVVFYLNPRDVNDRKIERTDALKKGDAFFKRHGQVNMVPTYSWIENNVLTVSYAYKQEDVIIYPDLIKLKIAMDNGQVIGYEALGYLMSHRKRELAKPKIKESEIRERLDDGEMEVESIRLALIPTPGLYEALTWEARVQRDEETYMMYYDVETGEERNVLRVIDTPEGTFAD
jgi:germination protein YpeB